MFNIRFYRDNPKTSIEMKNLANAEAATHRYSVEKVFWKYAANLQGTAHAEGRFNKVAKQLYWNHTLAWVFFCKFAAYFQDTFSEEHLWTAASANSK